MTPYLVQKHKEGLAILTWDVDKVATKMEDDGDTYYFISYSVYNSKAELIEEDCLKGCHCGVPEHHSQQFMAFIIETYRNMVE